MVDWGGFVTVAAGFGGRQSPWQRLVKRMTRFFTKLDADGSYRALQEACEKMGYGWKKSCTNQVGAGGHSGVVGHVLPSPVASGDNWGPPTSFEAVSQVTISTTDRRNNKLIFKVNLVEMESKILVDFRLSKVSRGGQGVGTG